jgi:hypothetical protein
MELCSNGKIWDLTKGGALDREMNYLYLLASEIKIIPDLYKLIHIYEKRKEIKIDIAPGTTALKLALDVATPYDINVLNKIRRFSRGHLIAMYNDGKYHSKSWLISCLRRVLTLRYRFKYHSGESSRFTYIKQVNNDNYLHNYKIDLTKVPNRDKIKSLTVYISPWNFVKSNIISIYPENCEFQITAYEKHGNPVITFNQFLKPVYYKYDGMGRLISKSNHKKDVLQQYEYNYLNDDKKNYLFVYPEFKYDRSERLIICETALKSDFIYVATNSEWELQIPEQDKWISAFPKKGKGNQIIKLSFGDIGSKSSKSTTLLFKNPNNTNTQIKLDYRPVKNE